MISINKLLQDKKIINIKKTYPPFDGKSPDTNEIPSLFIDVK